MIFSSQQTNTIDWHDFYPSDHALRLQAINQFWANVQHDFPITFPTTVTPVRYDSMRRLNGYLHRNLDPVATQKSVFGMLSSMLS